MAKQKHLTTEQRSTIQDMLSNKCTFTEIGDAIGKDPSTVAKEIKKHLNFSKVGYRYVQVAILIVITRNAVTALPATRIARSLTKKYVRSS